TFSRLVRAESGERRVLALAGVCTDPGRRGEGLGRKVVEAAFHSLSEESATVCLFQTGVPEFYHRLGAREVFNRFHNGQDPEGVCCSPWWNPHVMIYPAGAPWPEGPIDLQGPGY